MRFLLDATTNCTSLSGLPGLCFSNHINKNKIPIGVQFISRKFREDQLFKVAYDLEKLFPEINTITPDY